MVELEVLMLLATDIRVVLDSGDTSIRAYICVVKKPSMVNYISAISVARLNKVLKEHAPVHSGTKVAKACK